MKFNASPVRANSLPWGPLRWRQCTHLAKTLILILILPSTGFLTAQRPTFRVAVPTTGLASTDQKKTSVDNDSKRYAPNRYSSLVWVINSIEKINGEEGPSRELLACLYRLRTARNQNQITKAGREIESLGITETESVEVLQRVIKATSLVGLIPLSESILRSLLAKGILPSRIAYTEVCSALRRAGKVEALETLLFDMARETGEPISVVALNTYFSALRDKLNKRGRGKSSRSVSLKPKEKDAIIEKTKLWISDSYASESINTELDVTSYGIALDTLAVAGAKEAIEDVWSAMIENQVRFDIYAYNSYLKGLANGDTPVDTKMMDLLNEMQGNGLQPDRYTIDLILVPMVRLGLTGDLIQILETFVQSHQDDTKLISNAFSAFLSTLVKAGEVGMARTILESFSNPSEGYSIEWKTRDFNTLITGYKKLHDEERKARKNREVPPAYGSGPRKEAVAVYRNMKKYGLRPDQYSLSSILGLLDRPNLIMRIIWDVTVDSGVDITPVTLRAALAACGEANDPSSASWLFDTFSDQVDDTRTWNGLLVALAKSAGMNSTQLIQSKTSEAASVLSLELAVPGNGESDETEVLGSRLDGLTPPEAAECVLKLMNSRKDKKSAPDVQSYCLAASAISQGNSSESLAMELFNNATLSRVPADGRFLNAQLRCFGENIEAALRAWKSDIRTACIQYEESNKRKRFQRNEVKSDLLAAYHGLLHVCGRALRPDIALRVVYAMNKEGVAVTETAMQCYEAGKRKRCDSDKSKGGQLLEAIRFVGQFESLLYVECSKYDVKDKRRDGEQRVRIIL